MISNYYAVLGFLPANQLPVNPIETNLTPIMTANNAPTPYVASCSTTLGGAYVAWKAFDNINGSMWVASGAANGNTVQWLSIDMGSSILVNMVKIGSRYDGPYNNEAPRDFSIEGSNDGTTWIELYRKLLNPFAVSETKSFYFGNTVNYRYYRLYMRGNNGNTSNSSTSEFKLLNVDQIAKLKEKFVNIIPVLTANTDKGITVSAAGFVSGEEPFRAFNGHAYDVWAHNATISWMKVDLGVGITKKVAKYRLYSRSSWATQMPKRWDFEGSNDDVTYTVLDSRSNVTFNTLQMQEFVVTTQNLYRYYRLNILTNGGDTNTALAQMEFSE